MCLLRKQTRMPNFSRTGHKLCCENRSFENLKENFKSKKVTERDKV